MLPQKNKINVVECAVPVPSLISQAFSKVDYADAYAVELPRDREYSVVEAALIVLTTTPLWVKKLMDLRNVIVSPFGIKTGSGQEMEFAVKPTFEPGTQVSFFKVYEKTAQEILLGEDDRHLDFRLSFLLQTHNHWQYLTVSTTVKYNNWLGRAYFLPVRYFHRIIVPAMLRMAVNHASQTNRRSSMVV